MIHVIIGVDIGGTKTALIMKDDSGAVLHKDVIKSITSSANAFFSSLVKLIEDALQTIGEPYVLQAIGIGMPGIINRAEGYAEVQNNLPLAYFPLKEKLQTTFQVEHVIVENDVKVAALMEYHGRFLTEETLLFITISTGIASTIIYKGEPIRGRGIAGEIGFSTLMEETTLEEGYSGPALEKKLKQLLRMDEPLAALLQQKEPSVQSTILNFIERIAQTIKEYVLLIDPHYIVIGGGVINYNEQLLTAIEQRVNELLKQHRVFQQRITTLESAIFKGDAGVQGAALLVTT